ncbi:hypothetical protein [Methylomonas koyamae]|uniref:hypothetical protein n=1 Tax=Methylomonas koyamae TaxID=702114 RepID=UPI00278C54C0|nr:hypothetical protein [Methylomonas koyamae]
MQGLGAEPLFVSRIGRDAAGAELLAAMQNHGMRQNGVETDAARPTGSVAVSIDNGQPSYRILEQQAYDYIAAMELPAGSELGLLYHAAWRCGMMYPAQRSNRSNANGAARCFSTSICARRGGMRMQSISG